MATLRKFIVLSPEDRRLLCRAFALLAITRVGLRLLPFRRFSALADRATRVPRFRSSVSTERVSWAVAAAARRLPGGATCLARAVVARLLLANQGAASRIVIGVARGEDRGLDAHAWVECEGRVITCGTEVDPYTPLLVQGGPHS